MDSGNNQDKDIVDINAKAKAKAKKKRPIKPTIRIKRLNLPLSTPTISEFREEIKALQKAFAQERGENHRFRELVFTYLQRGHL
jgi:hypothetical protein